MLKPMRYSSDSLAFVSCKSFDSFENDPGQNCVADCSVRNIPTCLYAAATSFEQKYVALLLLLYFPWLPSGNTVDLLCNSWDRLKRNGLSKLSLTNSCSDCKNSGVRSISSCLHTTIVYSWYQPFFSIPSHEKMPTPISFAASKTYIWPVWYLSTSPTWS